jgi:hypothetical protein
MSTRNKRIKKEIIELVKYNVVLEENWENQNEVTIKLIYDNEKLSLVIYNNYPFVSPKLYIYPNKNEMRMNYIEWFIKNKPIYNEIKQNLNITVECVCCNTITCLWAPTMKMETVLQEYIEYYEKYKKLNQIKEIYNKLSRFDNLIYKHIFDFLY